MGSLKAYLRVTLGVVEFHQTGKLITMKQINQLTKQTCVTHYDDNPPVVVVFLS